MPDHPLPLPRTLDDVPELPGALPLLGHMPARIRNLAAFNTRALATCGPMFWCNAGLGVRELVIADPRITELLKARQASVSFYEDAVSSLIGGSLLTMDGEPHRRVRSTMGPAFSPKMVRSSDVITVVDEVARKHVERWLAAGRVEVLAATQELALEIIVRLIGIASDDLPRWRTMYQRYLKGALPTMIDTPLHWWARRARDFIDRGLADIVAQLRASGRSDTLAGSIANARDEQGELLPVAQIVPNLRVLVLAGHETTASSLAWTILFQARDADSQARAKTEVEAAAHEGVELGALALDGERFTWAEKQFREALRLYPPVATIVRRLAEPLEFQGVEIPAGTQVAVPILYFMREGSSWTEPRSYQPERFETRPRPTTIDTLMFGGGPHFCLGYHIAIAEGTLALLTLARMLADAGMTMVPERPNTPLEPHWVPLTHPPPKAAVRFVRA